MDTRQSLRTLVRGAYDVQKLRIAMGNRIVGNFKAKLGQKPSTPETEMDAEARALLDDLRARFRKLTDGVKRFPRQADFVGDEVISTFTELALIAQYVALEEVERAHFKRLEAALREFDVYTEYLVDVRGIGPAMAGVIVSEIDIATARYPSSLWKYAGLDVGVDGRGRSRREEHLVEIEYTNKEGKPATRRGITFNPFLKTKLMGVLATSFLRAGNEDYCKIYNDYKHRLESHARYGIEHDKEKIGKSTIGKAWRHQASLRYMMKMFLVDLYKAWRAIEGLPVALPYHEAKLGMVHGAA